MIGKSLHTAWAELFLSSLRRAGVTDVVVSPGSRSTPLALAAAVDPHLRVQVILDERVAAFFALGQARQSGRPSVLVCTSGTAPAHYLPAVIEASQSHIPLLLVTADRPWEDYDCGAAQTVDQVKLFGDYVRHYAELGLPDSSGAALRAVVRVAGQAVSRTLYPLPGPVHVNARFRKPLEPVFTEDAAAGIPAALLEELKESPAATAIVSDLLPSQAAVELLVTLCKDKRRGIIICGPAHVHTSCEALRVLLQRLSVQTGFPIFAESTSGVRFGVHAEVCGGFDAFLRDAELTDQKPELLVEIGGFPVSSSYANVASRWADCRRVVIAPHGVQDPIGTAQHVNADPVALLAKVCDLLPAQCPDTGWHSLFAQAEKRHWQVVQAELSDPILSEGAVAHGLCLSLPDESVLLVGNSLPVRDLDLFCPPSEKPLRVLHQRGASGIDGLIATAAGVKSQTSKTVALLLGDLSAQHDLGGLAPLAEASGPLVVVIVQNGGGRIFEQLPVGSSSAAAPHFAKLFLTPQTIDFAQAAAAFGIPFVRAASTQSYQAALAQGIESERPLIIEAVVPGDDGLARRKRIWKRSPQPSSQKARSEAQPWVFLHGFLGSPALWTDPTESLSIPSLIDHLPGHGPSPWTLPDADFFAVIDQIADRIKPPRFGLCGYSMGARLALALAIRHPQRVSSLMLIGVDPGIVDDAERQARIQWEDRWVRLLLEKGLPSFVSEWEKLPLFASQNRLSQTSQLQQRLSRLQHRPDAILWALRTLGTGRMPNLWPHVPSLQMPISLVTGEVDEKFSTIAQKLTSIHPFIEHHVISGSGHNPILEAPAQMLAVFSSHLTRSFGESQR